MTDRQGVRNETGDGVQGPVIQAGSIHRVSFGEPAQPALLPRQLPSVVRDFTGRAEHLAALDALLPGENDGNGADSVVISAVDGMAGIGKTTLAMYWAHRVQHLFPDGTLYASLRGCGPGDPAAPGEVLDGFLRALGAQPERIPAGLDARAALFRSMLAKRRVLIVLDNANDADQVRPLLPGTPGCVVVITSRDSLTGLVVTDAAHRLTLDLLTQHEALDLVAAIIGPTRVASEHEAAVELIRLCARLPLAMRIAAGRVAANPHIALTDVVAELADERSRLAALSRSGDERAAVRSVFDWSYRRLPQAQAMLFRRLGLHPGPDVSLPAAASVAGLDLFTAGKLIDDLSAAHLIEPGAGNRYRFHDLLRAYALNQAHFHDSAADRDHAVEALITWYAATAHSCLKLAYPGHSHLPLNFVAPVHLMSINGQAQALGWLRSERANLVAALHQAVRSDLHRQAVHLAEQTSGFLIALGRKADRLESADLGLAAAQRCGDRVAEVHFQLVGGDRLRSLRRPEAALARYRRALTMACDLGDRVQEAWVLNSFGLVCYDRGQFAEALQYFEKALERSQLGGRQQAAIEGNFSAVHTSLGHYSQALEYCDRSLALRQSVGDYVGEAYALHQLALIRQKLGDHQAAIGLCRDVIARVREPGDLGWTSAEPLDTLAHSLHRTGSTDAAIACWQEAADIFDADGDAHRAAQVREHLNTINVVTTKLE
ncbi:tetratricopeptide repeat protein [Amycolatopsis sp. NPDC004079]|uniref:ATP-binding protein n=1 Tax=Amycolatopsis sp. NPDC004079 TaxID=3154549 RepID=UPI0033B75FCE